MDRGTIRERIASIRENMDAHSLAAKLKFRQPQPDLTHQIETCTCSGEVKAGLYLINGDWERAHMASQSLHSSLAAHWHALVHRHEPDYSNSKYWLRKVGKSEIYPQLVQSAKESGHTALVTRDDQWEPFLFTDCFARPDRTAWTVNLDELEMQLLLEFSLKQSD